MNNTEIEINNIKNRIGRLEISQKYLVKKDLWIIFLASFGSFLFIYLVNVYLGTTIPLLDFIFSAFLVVAFVMFVYLFINKERLG